MNDAEIATARLGRRSVAAARAIALACALLGPAFDAAAQHTYPGQPKPLAPELVAPEGARASDARTEATPGAGSQGSLEKLSVLGFEPGPLERDLQARLPFLKRLAGKIADRLPLPLGVHFAYTHQWDEQVFTSNQISFRGETFSIPSSDFSRLDTSSDTSVGIVDAWVLPFLNVYGLGGYTSGALSFDVTLPALGVTKPRHVERRFHGATAGGGVVVGAAYRSFFALVDVTCVTSNLDIFRSSIRTLAVAPRLGYEHVLGPLKGVLSMGPNYYNQSSLRASSFDLGGETIDVDFRVKERRPWNFTMGGRVVLFHRMELAVSGSVGTRRSVIARLGMRF